MGMTNRYDGWFSWYLQEKVERMKKKVERMKKKGRAKSDAKKGAS